MSKAPSKRRQSAHPSLRAASTGPVPRRGPVQPASRAGPAVKPRQLLGRDPVAVWAGLHQGEAGVVALQVHEGDPPVLGRLAHAAHFVGGVEGGVPERLPDDDSQREPVGQLKQEAEHLGLVDRGHRGRERPRPPSPPMRGARGSSGRASTPSRCRPLSSGRPARSRARPPALRPPRMASACPASGRPPRPRYWESGRMPSAASAVAGSKSTTSSVPISSLLSSSAVSAPPTGGIPGLRHAPHLGGAAGKRSCRPLGEGPSPSRRRSRGGRAGGGGG